MAPENTEAAAPPTAQTIGRHLSRCHGYEIAFTVAEHPSVLLGQHERIHQQIATSKINHTHSADV